MYSVWVSLICASSSLEQSYPWPLGKENDDAVLIKEKDPEGNEMPSNPETSSLFWGKAKY